MKWFIYSGTSAYTFNSFWSSQGENSFFETDFLMRNNVNADNPFQPTKNITNVNNFQGSSEEAVPPSLG